MAQDPSHADQPPARGPTVSGKAIVVPIALLLAAAIAVVAAHEWQQLGTPPQRMAFERLGPEAGMGGAGAATDATSPGTTAADAASTYTTSTDETTTDAATTDGAQPRANTTAPFLLTFDAVHKEHDDPFLEDHLDTAVERGASAETEVLRIERMQATLASITGHDGPDWLVTWRGVHVRITLATGPA